MTSAQPETQPARTRQRSSRLVLALETSCDDTCAAVADGPRVLSNVISSQASFHARYGGVVPEVASRHHLELVNPVVDAALGDAGIDLDDVDSVAVTRGPGLIGALLVGISTAKGLAAARRKPLAGIDHLHGHVAANFLEPAPLEPPFLCLIASGGHTLLAAVRERGRFEMLGQTLDDAAGEALDKAARLLGLGYPGGPAIERAAAGGDPEAFSFPIPMRDEPGLDFSFSGLKTALVYAVRDLSRPSSGPGGRTSRPASRRPSSSSSPRGSSERWTPRAGTPSRSAVGSRRTRCSATGSKRSATGAASGSSWFRRSCAPTTRP